MLEGLWLRLMMGAEDVTRETALQAANEFLSAAFPRHYPLAVANGAKPA
jgi:TetR/AcrR family transcriptional repressor of bet genes